MFQFDQWIVKIQDFFVSRLCYEIVRCTMLIHNGGIIRNVCYRYMQFMMRRICILLQKWEKNTKLNCIIPSPYSLKAYKQVSSINPTR